jgi:cytochrome c oxidase accessory protein FixG
VVFWPQDFIFLTWLLIIAALALFFSRGRRATGCGYACPQTVWTETFLWMERVAEGGRSARQKLDRGPWDANKLVRKSVKQLMWVTFALWTGFTFVGYFSPIRTLGQMRSRFSSGLGNLLGRVLRLRHLWQCRLPARAGVQYMCPYARFQSAMFDKDTLVITYDGERGEPRGARKRGTDPREQGLGDCIDCTWCVQVCPTGIDIRQGLQIECIACAACIDACDDVMDKVGSPRGLIRYTTEHALHHEPTRLLRPRVLIYGGLLSALIIGFVVTIAMRSPVSLDVLRDRNSLYRLTDDGNVDNVYTLRILNKTEREQRFRIEAHGASALTLLPGDREYRVASGAVYSLPLRVRRAAYEPLGPETITLTVRSVDDPQIHSTTDARFLAPAK